MCGHPLSSVFADLGETPLSNAFLRAEDLDRFEPRYPLTAYVCEACFLVQLPVFEAAEAIFDDYAYFSSFSESWLDHCRVYREEISGRLGLGADSLVMEIASNDGYLLKYFKDAGIPALGIEPSRTVAEAAREKGIETLSGFFSSALAAELAAGGKKADLLIGNNVLAHVPELNDFVAGMKMVLASDGVITMEFPHLARLIDGVQFDTIYHEHFSYFSFTSALKLFAGHGLTVFDVIELPTHGGSLRIYARHAGNEARPVSENVPGLLAGEQRAGLGNLDAYKGFNEKIKKVRNGLIAFLEKSHEDGKSVCGYGAPAKGNTLLNCCGVGKDLLPFTVDRNPYKQGRFLPGSHIPIEKIERIAETEPDYVLILPWNLAPEIMDKIAFIRDWGGRFVIPIPELRIVD